jgi:hypothetical protein
MTLIYSKKIIKILIIYILLCDETIIFANGHIFILCLCACVRGRTLLAEAIEFHTWRTQLVKHTKVISCINQLTKNQPLELVLVKEVPYKQKCNLNILVQI